MQLRQQSLYTYHPSPHVYLWLRKLQFIGFLFSDERKKTMVLTVRNNVDVGLQQRESSRYATGMILSWQDLSVYAMDRNRRILCKQLINNVRGIAKPGEFTAILGGSGAGKSSLMTALAFRTEPCTVAHGDIRVNGVLTSSSYMKRYSGFMHQEDMFIETMTVLEHIWFTARMRLDRRIRDSDVRSKISRLLRDVGLIEKRNARIGGGDGNSKFLSGGERKRLTFATVLLTDPEILFLDEPTTGLDAYSAGLLVSLLTSFASKGRTILCTIHQPSSSVFDTFHRIIVLAGGRVAFAGTNAQAIRFFSSQGYECPCNYNPADFLIATLAIKSTDADGGGRVAQKMCDAFLTSDTCNEIDDMIQQELHDSRSFTSKRNGGDSRVFKEQRCCLRLYWLIHRGLLQVLRDPSVQLIRILQKICVATIAGLCFVGAVDSDQLGIQAVEGVIYVLVCENTFFPMYSTLALIPQELPLLLREYRAGMYSIHLYYIARMISLMPGLMVEPLIFTVIIYWLTGLRATFYAFSLTLFIVTLTMNVSTACGCFFSVAYDSVPLAMAYLVPFDYILMITMGPFIKPGSLPIYIRWVRYFSWLLHSTETLSIIQWKGVHNITCETAKPELPCVTEGYEVLDRYDFDVDNFWIDVVLMAMVYVVFHLSAYILLWKRCRSR